MSTPTTRPLAVVTGASKGIGFELAKQFAQNGYDLVIAAGSDEIEHAAQELEALGTSVRPVQVDLAGFDGVEQLYAEIASAGRPVDAIAINAGVGVSGDFSRETDLRDELKLINLNVTSTVHLAKRVLADMARRGEGKVLFTSSIAATQPGPYETVYAASKAFVYYFALGVRQELKDTGVTVTALMPGPTETEFFERADMLDTKLGQLKSKDDPADVAREGYEALMAGKDHIITGSFKNKVQAAAGTLLPDKAVAAGHAKMSAPGSGTS